MEESGGTYLYKGVGVPSRKEVEDGWPRGTKMVEVIDEADVLRDWRPWTPEPWGYILPMEQGVLSQEQQEKTERLIRKRQAENEIYLASHPEIEAVIAVLLKALIIRKPLNVRGYVKNFFKNSDIEEQVKLYLAERNIESPEKFKEDIMSRSGLDTVYENKLVFMDGELLRKMPPDSELRSSPVEEHTPNVDEEEEDTPVHSPEEDLPPSLLDLFDNPTEIGPDDVRWPIQEELLE